MYDDWRSDISELLILAEAKFFPDKEVLERSFKNYSRDMRPMNIVYCASSRELLLAQVVAPDTESIEFRLNEDLLEEQPTLSREKALKIVENQISEIEKIFGYYGDETKRTDDYMAGKQMIRKQLFSELEKQYNIF